MNGEFTEIHIFSEDPTFPLNQEIEKIKEALAGCPMNKVNFGMIQDICRKIFVLGFDDGKSFVYNQRQGS
jgi:hypothetical protein